MKFINKKILFAVTALFIIALMPFIQSCSNNNELEGTEKIESSVELTASEKNEIINSSEFKEYVDANIEIAALMKSLKVAQQNSSKVKSNVGRTPLDGKAYKASPFDYDYDKFKLMIKKVKALGEKFPSAKKMNQTEMKSLILESISKSKEFQQKMIANGLISLKRKNVRQKTTAENVYLNWNNKEDAYLFTNLWAFATQKECAGFVMADGTAVVYIDPCATRTSCDYPTFKWEDPNGNGLVAFYNGSQITETFHVHFKSYNYSSTDSQGQELCFPNATMTIFYRGYPYTYNYTNGTTYDSYDWMINH